MSTFKSRIQKEIVAPAGHIRRTFTIIGTVIESDEKNNFCSVRFIDKDGYMSNKNNVPVVLYNSSIIDWFPKIGELVNIEQNGELVRIISKYEGAYGIHTRPGTELKKDVLCDSFDSTIAGVII